MSDRTPWTPDDAEELPTRVCPNCSTQSRTRGDYCPHCGSSFLRRKRRLGKRGRIVLGSLLALIVVGGGGAAAAVKIHHDKEVKAERAEEKARAARAARERREAEAEAERERDAAEEAKAALDDIERDSRRDLEKGLRKSITKDAEQNVAEGLLEGPILRTTCDPVGGGRDDLSSRTGKYECLAVTTIEDDGSYSGYSYHGTVNYKKYSWSWGLGRG
jgi:hypothetical protein